LRTDHRPAHDPRLQPDLIDGSKQTDRIVQVRAKKEDVRIDRFRLRMTDLDGNTATDSFLRTGWTVGAGLEYALDDHWSAKIEYDYLDFGQQSINFTTPIESVNSSASLNVQEVKAGLNFRFNDGQ
jgi:opacity protein-like surface antigen